MEFIPISKLEVVVEEVKDKELEEIKEIKDIYINEHGYRIHI